MLATKKDLAELHQEIRELRIQVGQLLGMDAVAKLVEIGAEAARLDTTPMEQTEFDAETAERVRSQLREKARAKWTGLVEESEEFQKWMRHGTTRES